MLKKLKKYVNRLPYYGMTAGNNTVQLKVIRNFYNCHVLWHVPAIQKKILLLASRIIWPVWAAILAVRQIKINGQKIRRRYQKSLPRQFFEQLGLALFKKLKPKYYYYFRFYNDRTACDYYVTDNHATTLFKYLNRNKNKDVLGNKYQFAVFCRAHDIPTVPIFADFANGKVHWIPPYTSLPRIDLIFKLCNGVRAKGLHRWHYFHNDLYKQSHQKRLLSERDLVEQYQFHSETGRYLVQPRLYNHPAIDDLSNGSLITIRALTAIIPGQSVQLLSAMFNMPTGDEIINNLSNHALSCQVNLTDGTLSKAFCKSVTCQFHDTHIDTGAVITGRKIPCWEETAEFAVKAHQLIGDFAFIGWDIAITETGPLFLEGNNNPSLNFHQLPPGRPFGQTEFADILAWHVSQ